MRPERIFTRLSSLAGKPSEQDRADSLVLAVSARRFSRRTQAVLDDKLSFSATLMRAGEVEAANRLLAEVGEEVLTEEVALLEKVNEVKAARSAGGRDKVTRGRLARTLAVAMLGSSLFAFSAAGAAMVGLFRDNDQAAHGSEPDAAPVTVANDDRVLGTHHVRVLDNVSLKMTSAQFREYSKLTSGVIDEDELESFLLDLLPPALAEKVHFALVAGLEVLPAPVSEEIVAASEKVFEKKVTTSDARQDEEPAPKDTEEPKAAEPTPEPSPGDESPSPESSPEESPEDGSGLPIFGGEEDEEGS